VFGLPVRPAGAALIGAALLAACSNGQAQQSSSATSASFWRPQPVEKATEPSEVIKNADTSAWRDIAPDNLLVMDLAAHGGFPAGRVLIELAPDFAPVHVANIRALARGNWWQGAAIYRVQDNYVVQWGLNESDKPLPAGVVKTPPAEYHRPIAGLDIRPTNFPDSYAPATGYAGGWPVAYDPEGGRASLTHCYAMVGVGRDLAPDTGMGGELYAVIGHAPRHLDRNIALVGRVVEGMELMSARPRGTEALGFIKDTKQHVPISRIRLAADLPAAERPALQVMRTDTPTFAAYLLGRANRGGSFFNVPAGGVDLCNAPVPMRRRP
jgi:peptidylprolyl isomerase